MIKITPAIIKDKYEINNPDGFFFTPNNMKFAADTMSNYASNSEVHQVETWTSGVVPCYMLRRKRAVKGGLSAPAFFSVDGFKLIHSKED